jgi:hypothetical protein
MEPVSLKGDIVYKLLHSSVWVSYTVRDLRLLQRLCLGCRYSGSDATSLDEWFSRSRRNVMLSFSRVKQFKKNWTTWSLQMSALLSFENLETTHPMTQPPISGHLYPPLYKLFGEICTFCCVTPQAKFPESIIHWPTCNYEYSFR